MPKLRAGQWARKFSCCKNCKSNVTPHKGLGLCEKCYSKSKNTSYQQTQPYKEALKKYRKSNRYFDWYKRWLYQIRVHKPQINTKVGEGLMGGGNG